MPYPTILAGQRTTAALLTSMLPITVLKTAATGRSSTTTTSADPELQAFLDANATYVISGVIATSNTGATGATAADLKCTITGTATSTGRWSLILPSTTSAADPDAVRVATNALGTTLLYGHPNAGVIHGALDGYISVGATGGTVSFDWAQNTSNAFATNIREGSWMSFRRVS